MKKDIENDFNYRISASNIGLNHSEWDAAANWEILEGKIQRNVRKNRLMLFSFTLLIFIGGFGATFYHIKQTNTQEYAQKRLQEIELEITKDNHKGYIFLIMDNGITYHYNESYYVEKAN